MNPADTLSRLTVDQLRAVLLVGMQCGDFSPLEFAPDPSAGLQLQELFINATAPTQEKLKRAVARAASEWRPRAHSTEALLALSYLALDIGASEAVPVIAGWVRREERALQPPAHVLRLVAVLAGFAPVSEARDALERLQATRLGAAAGSVVLNGLCKCEPNAFPRYLSWFLDLPGVASGAFHLGCVVSEMVRIVGLPRINAGMGELAPAHFKHFLALAQEEVMPALSFITTGGHRMMLCEREHAFDLAAEAELGSARPVVLPPSNALIAAAAHGRQVATTGVSTYLRGLADLFREREVAA